MRMCVYVGGLQVYVYMHTYIISQILIYNEKNINSTSIKKSIYFMINDRITLNLIAIP